MNVLDWIRPEQGEGSQLLRDARRIAAGLPAPADGTRIALAFGHDRRAFASSLLACWLRGHGAAVVENTLRERIMPVLEHPSVVHLLHDTGSGRTLQVPRWLARATGETPATEPAPLPSGPMLSVHAQSDDGDLRWCDWHAAELMAAVDAVAAVSPERRPELATPGQLASLFADTLTALRGHQPLPDAASRIVELAIPGAPPIAGRHRERVAELLRHDGIDDAAIVNDAAGAPLVALVGPAAADVAADVPGARALAAIPRDPNGQPRRAELCLLFGLGRDGQPVQRTLQWRDVERSGDAAVRRAHLPTDYLFYQGHFTGYPVLAGGVQLHELVLPCLRALTGELPPLPQLDGIKFLARFEPGDTIDVALQRTADPRKVTFEIRRGDTRCTSGRLVFDGEVAPFVAAGGASA
ncbi:MAG: hypothetical protein KAI24_06610 [Planctomycetes bacterium]|nr:hypothetical protein [Planctomycetota bacterium]